MTRRHTEVDPANPPPILTTHQLCDIMGRSHTMVWSWAQSDPALAACIIRRTKGAIWWSTQRLRDGGYLTREGEVNTHEPA